MLLTVSVLVALVASALGALVRPSRFAAFVLVVASAFWLPANNDHLEGPVLYTADPARGLTVADLASFAGFAIAVLTIARWWARQEHDRRSTATSGSALPPLWRPSLVAVVALVAVFASALAYQWVHQPV